MWNLYKDNYLHGRFLTHPMVQSTNTWKQSEASLLLKMKKKFPEPKKDLPGKPSFLDTGKEAHHISQPRQPFHLVALCAVTRPNQPERASPSEAACMLTGHDTPVARVGYHTPVQCRMTYTTQYWGGYGLRENQREQSTIGTFTSP